MKSIALTLMGLTSILSLGSFSWARAIPESAVIQDDNRFSQQAFSQALFWHIPHGVRACHFYGMTDLCSFERKHYFSDAVLVTEKDSTAFIQSALIPNQPVSQAQALAYAQILDGMGGNGVEFINPEISTDNIYYFGCPWVGGNLCLADLTLTPDGNVAEIIVIYTSP
ncbi:MAG: hypothetical protein AAGH78_17560 [Cyanobacteria bacterium P01_H01_bin.58]